MDPELKKAWIVAGVKLAVGLVLLLTVMGLRVVSAPRGEIESEVAELEQLQATLARAASSANAAAMSGSAPSQRGLATGESANQEAGESGRMVACEIGGGRQFMSAGDCAMRGGRAQEI